jgi:sodium transport system permease protein
LVQSSFRLLPAPRRAALRVLGTEVRGLLRDRRALFAGVILPVLLYPLLFAFNAKIEGLARSNMAAREIRLGLDERGLQPELAQRVRAALLEQEPLELVEFDGQDWRERALALHEGRPEAVEWELREARRKLSEGLDLLLIGASHPVLPARPYLRLCHSESDDVSAEAERRVRQALEQLHRDLREEQLDRALGSADPGRWLAAVSIDVASQADASGSALGRMLPLLAMAAVFSAAAYAALSCFAGEREAQSLETLLVAPVPARSIAWGKYLSVVGVAACALLGNLSSFVVCAALGWVRMGGQKLTSPWAEGALGLERMGLALLAISPAVLLVCAALVLVSARARTFREGQQLLLPLAILVMAPAALAGASDVPFDPAVACLPLFGSCLALRDALRGSLLPLPLFVSLSAQLAWTGLLLRALPHTLDAERIFAAASTEEEQLQRQMQSRAALLWGLLGVIAVYAVGGWLQALWAIGGLLATLWLLLPALAVAAARGTARRARESLADVLGLVRPRGLPLLGALLLAPALAWLVREWVPWQQRLLPLPSRALERGAGLEFLRELSVPALLFLMALSPAVGEELFFRGAIQSGLRKDLGALRAVSAQALLFAAAHASIYRFVPTFLVGLALGALRERTRCLGPCMVLHAAYDAWVLLSDRAAVLQDWRFTLLAIPGVLLVAGASPGPPRERSPDPLPSAHVSPPA